MEPIKILSLTTRSKVRAGDYGWLIDPSSNSCEFSNEIMKFDESDFIRIPHPQPKTKELIEKDACFCEKDAAFEVLFKDDYNWYTIMRCKKHRRLFLDDSRGTICQYILRIFIEDEFRDSDFKTIWRTYHTIPDDYLFYKKIAVTTK